MSLPQAFLDALPAMSAAALSSGSDYKALVYVMLNGGNDNGNTVIPTGAGYAAYASARGALALTDGETLALSGQSTAKLHPNLTGLQSVFDAGRCAIMCNVGTLVVPTTKAQYAAKSVPVPKQLMSHSDQINQAQTSISTTIDDKGWGGRACDLLEAAFNPGASVSMAVSASSNAVYLTGYQARGYQVGTSGPVNIPKRSSYSSHAPAATALTALLNQSSTHPIEQAYLTIAQGSIANYATVTTAIGSTTMNVTFPTTSLGNQLKVIARMIRGRATLGARRQVFFANVGGFDTHANQATDHAALMTQIGAAIKAFDDEMQVQGMGANVTLATGSDFGRALTPNGSGTDHGWGSHHFIVGDAVQGGIGYKATNGASLSAGFPDCSLLGPYDIGQGRLAPTTAVDEYGATLMRWLGVPDAQLGLVFPNLAVFGSRNLGFLS